MSSVALRAATVGCGLALAGLEDVSHVDLVDLVWRDSFENKFG